MDIDEKLATIIKDIHICRKGRFGNYICKINTIKWLYRCIENNRIRLTHVSLYLG